MSLFSDDDLLAKPLAYRSAAMKAILYFDEIGP